MCGIVVLLDPDIFDDPAEALALGLEAIAHRGLPGRVGAHHGEVYIGHARLPIRGLGREYDQPFVTAKHVSAVVGEVFGIDEENDSQYIVNVLHEDAPEGVAEHDGFWNIVDFNKATGDTRILMDHLAIKPLYWDTRSNTVASELRAIEAVNNRLKLDQHYLSNVRKWGYDPRGDTPYEGVQKLKAGYCYTFNKGKLLHAYRYFPLQPHANLDLRAAIIKATHDRLVSDIPYAVLCSGGLDSTIVALLAAQRGVHLSVYHIDNDEAEFVEAIKWPSNVSLCKLPLRWTSLETALAATEEPVDLGSVLPQYQLGAAVRLEGFHVALSGDGADELFGGYRRAKEYDSQYSDIFTELVHYHLPRLDKTMMASTVELRSPFLAPDVVRAALAVPYADRTEKQVLKRLFSDIVPDAILEREKKPLRVVGYNADYRHKIVADFIKRKTHD